MCIEKLSPQKSLKWFFFTQTLKSNLETHVETKHEYFHTLNDPNYFHKMVRFKVTLDIYLRNAVIIGPTSLIFFAKTNRKAI